METNQILQDSFIIKKGKLVEIISQHPISTKEYSALVICTKGEINFNINNKEISIKKNELIGLKPFASLHTSKVTKDCEGFAFGIHNQFFQHLSEPIIQLEPLHILRLNTFSKIKLSNNQVENLEDIFSLLEKQYTTAHSFFKFQKVKSLFNLITYEIMQILTEDKQFNTNDFTRGKIITSNFFILLNTNIHQKKGVDYFAKKLNITSKHLIASVKATTQETPRKIIDKMLLNQAQFLLSKTENSIQMVAENLGFSDASSFTKFFKRITGYTPKQFRSHKI